MKSYKVVDNPFYRAQPYTSDKPVTKGKTVYQPGELIPADPDWMATQYQFVFEIAEGPEKGRWLSKRTGTMLTANERNHMYKLFSKIIPQDYLDALISDGDAPDIDDDIVGQPVICVVEVSKTKNGRLVNKINSFMRSDRKPSAEEVVYVDSIEEAREVFEDDIPF